MLTTTGGDAHAAYRIARALHLNYCQKGGQMLIFVNNICASAGTLITLAANKLILSDHAELGPIDVQIRKTDEIGERTSGLTPIQALNFLENETQKFFSSQFSGLRFSRAFSTKMAADISAALASGLLSRLYEQIDPLRLAEYDRLLRIAEQYGDRIKTANVKPHAIKQLLEGYPAHDFSIDPTEAKELFNNVEGPTHSLESLGNELKDFAERCLANDETSVLFLDPLETESPQKANHHENKVNNAQPNGDIGASGGRERQKKATVPNERPIVPSDDSKANP